VSQRTSFLIIFLALLRDRVDHIELNSAVPVDGYWHSYWCRPT